MNPAGPPAASNSADLSLTTLTQSHSLSPGRTHSHPVSLALRRSHSLSPSLTTRTQSYPTLSKSHSLSPGRTHSHPLNRQTPTQSPRPPQPFRNQVHPTARSKLLFRIPRPTTSFPVPLRGTAIAQTRVPIRHQRLRPHQFETSVSASTNSRPASPPALIRDRAPPPQRQFETDRPAGANARFTPQQEANSSFASRVQQLLSLSHSEVPTWTDLQLFSERIAFALGRNRP